MEAASARRVGGNESKRPPVLDDASQSQTLRRPLSDSGSRFSTIRWI